MEAELVAAFVLGAVEREIGLHHHAVDVGNVAAIGNDADAGGGLHLIAVDAEGTGDDFADLGRQRFDIAGVFDAVLQHGKFVAAEAGDHVGLAYAALEAFGDRLQQLVADRMAERVVDVLEVVEIDIVHGKLIAAAPGAREFQIEPFQECCAVGKAG